MDSLFSSFYLSDLCNEAGFHAPCFCYYSSNRSLRVGLTYDNSVTSVKAPLHHQVIDWIAEQYPTAKVTLPMPYEELDNKLIESVKYIINEQKKQRGS